MIAQLVALLVVPLAGPQNGAEVVSKMLLRYSDAKTLTGTIRFTQQLGDASITIDTNVQFEKPGKLYIRQVKTAGQTPANWLVTSDGVAFSYNVPTDTLGAGDTRRLLERVAQPDGSSLGVAQIYTAAGKSLGDKAAPLDIAIARIEDLKFLRNQWVDLDSEAGPNGLTVIKGQWREYATIPPTGTYEMWISSDGDLKKYVTQEAISAPQTGQKYLVRSTWDVNLVVNGKPDPGLFKVIR